MRLVIVLAVLFGFAMPAAAGRSLTFRELVAFADQRQAFVAAMAPAISDRCMQQQWGGNPPPALRDWLTGLILSDLGNRAKVMRGEISKQKAALYRKQQFFALEQIQHTELEAIAFYAGFSLEHGFGPSLLRVFACQYSALAKALGDEQPEI
jgi:hypothetical protein